MLQKLSLFAVVAMAMLAVACSPRPGFYHNRLEDKSMPNEMFALERSYPDTFFDWKGWRRVLREIRAEATSQAHARIPGCGNNSVEWTMQGPSNVAGRCNALAAKPDDENVVLAGFSTGGIFKTVDGAANWYPVFDDNIELSIGDITFDPSNPNIVYAGTGDPNGPSVAYNGNGVYKSTDAGESWSHLGLADKGIISKVVVNPANTQQIFAAAMGNPYVRDAERGIFRSNNGGATWEKVLFVSNQAGASDLVMSPANPNILYASFWDRIRNNKESVIFGPNAKIYKSSDGGSTWTQLTSGLPTGTLGRTGLAVSQTNPDKLYVLYIDSLSTPHSMHKTTDGGTSFTPVNITSLEDACGNFGWYFGKIRLNPLNDEDVYFLAILIWRKQAGSNSWMSAAGGHADSHDLIFTPSGRRYWANDGGVYRNNPGQMIWNKSKNLPTTQIYQVSVNPHEPSLYWIGTQDNGIQKGTGGSQINNWVSIFAADGFKCAFDPSDPQKYWIEIQNGTVHQTTDGGVTWNFGTPCLGTNDRCNWDTPLFMSKHNSGRMFAGTFRAYVSEGSGWAPISGDLTDGIIYGPRFHTVSCISESPLVAEKLLAGTTDGNVWRRDPAGTWVQITGNLPERYVTSVEYSPTLSNRIFVTHSGFRDNEKIARVHRSDDNGASWVNISGNLPQVPVNDIFIIPGHADTLLIAGTDGGVYYSRNSGQKWSPLGSNFPSVPVFDLDIHPFRNELVAATYARGIWTMPLDSILAHQPPVTVSLAGTIQTETADGVSNVKIGNVFSQSAGQYVMNDLPGCDSVTVKPYRNDNPLNGLTTFDLVLISKHILGIEPLGSPYKLIAADANKSGSVTTADIIAFRKLILGIDTTLANNTSWRFIDQSYVFPNQFNPFSPPPPESKTVQTGADNISDVNFKAVKIGDVNGTAAPNARAGGERSTGVYSLNISNQTVQQGEIFELMVGNTQQVVAAAQFTLLFDNEVATLERVESLHPSFNEQTNAHVSADQGLISFAFEPESSGPWFKLVFRARKNTQLGEILKTADSPTRSMVFNSEGNAFDLSLWSENTTGISFSPNPAGQEGIWCTLSNSDIRESILIVDSNGTPVHNFEIEPGNSIRLEPSLFRYPGVYFWSARNSGKTGSFAIIP
jgi:photosystem II stability/assembly factor-like uncharacterized protein